MEITSLCWRALLVALLLVSGEAVAQNAAPDGCFTEVSAKPAAIIAKCTKFVELRPSKALLERALNRRGLAYKRIGKLNEALADFNDLIVANPKNAGYFDNRQGINRALGKFSEALSDSENAVRLAPNSSFVYHSRATVYLEMGRFDEAVVDFSRVVQMAPEKVYSLYDRGRAQSLRRKYQWAIDDFSIVLEREPKFTAALRERAAANYELGRYEVATKDVDAYLTGDSNDASALDLKARIKEAMQRVGNDNQRPPTPAPPKIGSQTPQPKPYSTGTGFFVSGEGHVLTNAHVVEGCSTARVAQPGGKSEVVRVIATDATNDLALLSVGWRPASVPPLKSSVRTGEAVVTYGFPHVGMLPSTGNFTLGNVTATAGLGDDTRMLQISAPVQSGNSGGPLIDQSGNVVGIVTSKLNVLRAFKETGDLPQNVNFAIKASVARSFLEANGILNAAGVPLGSPAWSTGHLAAPLSAPDLADAAKLFTVFIACKG